MAKETERKFLVISDDYKKHTDPVLILQGFLNTDKNRTVRVRIKKDKAFLTIKTVNIGITRNEYEYEIPLEDAQELIDRVCIKPAIKKYRFEIMFKGFLWEVDEFLDDNHGLVLAEVELQSANQRFKKPAWIGREVSHDPRYYNANLVKQPFSTW